MTLISLEVKLEAIFAVGCDSKADATRYSMGENLIAAVAAAQQSMITSTSPRHAPKLEETMSQFSVGAVAMVEPLGF